MLDNDITSELDKTDIIVKTQHSVQVPVCTTNLKSLYISVHYLLSPQRLSILLLWNSLFWGIKPTTKAAEDLGLITIELQHNNDNRHWKFR